MKTTIVGVIRLNAAQVEKDIAVASSGGYVPSLNLNVTGVGYISYCLGCGYLDTRSMVLRTMLDGAGVRYSTTNIPHYDPALR